MDAFVSATLLSTTVIVVCALVFALADLPKWAKILVIVAAGQGVAQVVAASDFGPSQQILHHTIDTLNESGLIVVGLVLAGYAAVLYKLIDKAIPNIGDNQPPDVPPPDPAPEPDDGFVPPADPGTPTPDAPAAEDGDTGSSDPNDILDDDGNPR